MNIIKIAGCVCVATGAALWCFYYAASLGRRLDALDRARRFAVYVGEQIRFYETPYPRIVADFAAKAGVTTETSDGSPEALFAKEGVAPERTDGSPRGFAALGDALADGLEATDRERFLAFYNAVGAGTAETELRLCEECRVYFDERLGVLRGEFERKKRSRAAIALFAAFSVCVLVW